MRVLKDGTVKYKPSAYKNYERLAKPAFPLPRFPVGTKVQIYLGAGWSVASVVNSTQTQCVVRLPMGNRLITVHDARNIRTTTNE